MEVEELRLDGEELEAFKKQMVEAGALAADASHEVVKKLAASMGAWFVVATKKRKQRKD